MATARILQLPRAARTVQLDEGPETCRFIAAEIRRSNLSYKDLSERCGVCIQAISKIACEETKLPRHSTIIKIALALGWSIYAETAQ